MVAAFIRLFFLGNLTEHSKKRLLIFVKSSSTLWDQFASRRVFCIKETNPRLTLDRHLNKLFIINRFVFILNRLVNYYSFRLSISRLTTSRSSMLNIFFSLLLFSRSLRLFFSLKSLLMSISEYSSTFIILRISRFTVLWSVLFTLFFDTLMLNPFSESRHSISI